MSEVAFTAISQRSQRAASHIRHLLDQHLISYREVVDQPDLPAARRIQSVLLQDNVGSLLVLFPQSQLLDLNRLADLTGRTLVAQTQAPHPAGERPACALLQLTHTPCLYEGELLHEPSLLLEADEPGLLLEISSDDLKRLLNHCSAAYFAEAVSGIHPNLDRPLDDLAEIKQAVQTFTARRIQQRLEETIQIPMLEKTAQKIIQLRVDPNATIDDITGVVETDPALAAQLVSWAASPYYSVPGKIRSVEDAIVRVLGVNLVLDLALGLALGKTLSLPKDQPQHATPYWQQSIYTAAVIEGLTRAIPRTERPEAGLTYLAGLLHNFGYLVLAHTFPPHFSLVCRHIEVNPHLCPSIIEQHLLGITRQQIGAWLMRYWGMPQELVTALRFQHDPHYVGENAHYPNLVHLAVRLLRNKGIGTGPRDIPDSLLKRLSLSRKAAEDVVDKVLEAEALLREMASQFGC